MFSKTLNKITPQSLKRHSSSTKAFSFSYDPTTDQAPQVYQAMDANVAKYMLKVARRYSIPIKKDPELCEKLAILEEEQQIPPELYQDVAKLFFETKLKP